MLEMQQVTAEAVLAAQVEELLAATAQMALHLYTRAALEAHNLKRGMIVTIPPLTTQEDTEKAAVLQLLLQIITEAAVEDCMAAELEAMVLAEAGAQDM